MDRLFLIPDKCVILDVPKEVLVERVTGRRTDPETGKIYHLKFNPPKVDPDDESEEAAAKATAETEAIVARLTQREDDTEEALAKRLEAFDSNRAAIEDAFSAMAKVVDGNRAKDDVSRRRPASRPELQPSHPPASPAGLVRCEGLLYGLRYEGSELRVCRRIRASK